MPNPRTWTLPADLEAAVAGHAPRVERAGQGRAALGARRHASGPAPTRRAGSAGSAIVDEQRAAARASCRRFAEDVARRRASPTSLLLGMGGSSLGPEVLGVTFGPRHGSPELLVLDSTDPAQVRALRGAGGPRAHALRRVEQVGHDARAEHLQAVLLRPGAAGRRRRPRRASASSPSPTPARSSAGGRGRTASATCSSASRRSAGATRRCRTSAWCRRRSWGSTSRGCSTAPQAMARACAARRPPSENPGVVLGARPGRRCASAGRDKVTLVASPGIADLGAWLEQLLAESTGQGRARA